MLRHPHESWYPAQLKGILVGFGDDSKINNDEIQVDAEGKGVESSNQDSDREIHPIFLHACTRNIHKFQL